MKFIDITCRIEPEMQVYKNKEEKKPKLSEVANISNNGVRETYLGFNLHTGTHIDAPAHILNGGDFTEDYPLDRFFVPAIVVDFSEDGKLISAGQLLEKNIPENHFVLVKTQNSLVRNFAQDFAFVGLDGLDYLIEQKSLGIGIDASGVEFGQAGHPGHKKLFANNLLILEGIDLQNVKEGLYVLNFFPLKIKNSDASPVRAVLIEDQNLYLTLSKSSGDN